MYLHVRLACGICEYGCASFINQTSDIPADKLMRLRPNRVVYDAPPPYSGKGRPRSHGAKFKLNDSSTWWTPDETVEVNDPQMERLSIRLWCIIDIEDYH
ncbi:transposase [Aphanizomenon flos-aquae]